MAGAFIISFDCEGNWGFADKKNRVASKFINKGNLIQAYSTLTSLLAEFEIPATFAFVMAFLLDEEELSAWSGRLKDVRVDGANWMETFRDSVQQGDLSGWLCPEALEIVSDSGVHEVGCHGFRHIPLREGQVSEEEARYELACASKIAEQKGITLKTFVYPRNLVGHVGLLEEYGYLGFRGEDVSLRANGRVGSFLREFDVWQKAPPFKVTPGKLVAIPPSFFLNWQRGLRRAVPREISRLRWKSILESASTNDTVAGLYLHPHNVIDGPGTLDLLRDVLRMAADLRDRKGLSIMTQQEYCRQTRMLKW